MPTVQRVEHTSVTRAIVQRIKNSIKRENITFNDIIPRPSNELLEKKTYMQSNEFLNDSHNKSAFAIMDENINTLRTKFHELSVLAKKELGIK